MSDTRGELSPAETLRRMVTAYVISQAVYVAAKLGVADRLATGPRSAEALAAELGVQAGPLRRVLRLLAAVGVLSETGVGDFALTELGEPLRSDAPESVRAAAVLFCEEPFRASAHLLHTVRTGETAFDHVYGMSHFEYLARNPDPAATFHAAMTQLTGVVRDSLVAAYDFSQAAILVDVGAGEGQLLAGVLEAFPGLRGVLFEAETAIPGARRFIEERRLGARCEIVAGDFFQAVPPGGDLYLLKSVIHNWDDARAAAILRNCREAMEPDARLLVIERVVPEGEEPFFPKLNDIIMMAVTGGSERTEQELRALLQAAGFTVARLIPTRSGFTLIEGVQEPGVRDG